MVPYNVTLNGNVTQGGSPVQGATVQLLAPQYNGLVLSANVSNATGHYNLTVPWGTWVLQFSHTSGSDLFTNSTLLKVTAPTALHINPVLRAYAVSGRIFSSVTKSYITTEGNATLFDPSNHYIYTTPTPDGRLLLVRELPGELLARRAGVRRRRRAGRLRAGVVQLLVERHPVPVHPERDGDAGDRGGPRRGHDRPQLHGREHDDR